MGRPLAVVGMNWLARMRLSAGLRRLGHSPEWWRVDTVRYAHCLHCDGIWVGRHTNRLVWLAAQLRTAGACGGRGRG